MKPVEGRIACCLGGGSETLLAQAEGGLPGAITRGPPPPSRHWSLVLASRASVSGTRKLSSCVRGDPSAPSKAIRNLLGQALPQAAYFPVRPVLS